jgi:3-oxoacyl-[acyl-carrier-protein] synthase-3
MRWEDIYLSGSAVRLGQREYVREAVADGRYDPVEAAEDDYLSVSTAADASPADMAVAAAGTALDRAARPDGEFRLLLHASVGFQGIDHWSPAGYIQQRTIGGRAAAMEVKQASNGGMVALELAAAHLAAASGPAAALITTADRYVLPAFDRYRSDQGTLRGDGATAMVLNRGGGVARLLSTVLIGDSTHERLLRGDEPWAATSGEHGWPVDLRARREQYRAGGGDVSHLGKLLVARHVEAVEGALKDAGATVGEVARFVFPNISRKTADWVFGKRQLGIEEARTVWDWGRTVGHIGAGDQAAGLTRLLETAAVHPGDLVVLTGFGAGFTFGSAVLEIVEEAGWSPCGY